MAGAITLLAIAVIITDIYGFLLTIRMNRLEDAMTTALMALAILLKEHNKKKSKNNKATNKEKQS